MNTDKPLKRFLGAGVAVTVVAALFLSIPFLVKHQVRSGLRDAFPGAAVSVGRLSLERPLGAALADIAVRDAGLEITVAKVVLFASGELRVLRPSAVVRAWPARNGPGGAAPLPFKAVRVEDASLRLETRDVAAEIRGSFSYRPRDGRFTDVRAEVPSMRRGKFSVKDGALALDGEGRGRITVAEVAQDKFKVRGVESAAALDKGALALSGIRASVAGGRLAGSASVRISGAFSYEAGLEITGADLAALSDELDFKKKVGLGGRIDGSLSIEGDASGIKVLAGELRGTEGGGDIVINDRATLEALAKNVKQPIEIVEPAFKEYHFDSARVSVGLEGRAVRLGAKLEGAKGKRDLDVALHDFL